jgi:type IV pilus assembly protein PilY1
MVFGIACADDLEVYANTSRVDQAPNLLFIFDSSSSMNKTPLGSSPGRSDPSRLTILKNAIGEILSQDFGSDINIGYMDFRNSHGNGIKFPVSGIDNDAHDIDPDIPAGTTVRQVIQNLVTANQASGQTPTVEALYEAARYFRGSNVHLGKSGTFGRWDNSRNPPHYRGGSWRAANPASYTGSRQVTKDYVAPDTPKRKGVYERKCRDYSARPNSNRNDCAKIPDDSLFECQFYGEKKCTPTTKDVCISKSYPVHNSCITGPGNNANAWLSGNQRKCCTSADITNAECLKWKNLEQCDQWEEHDVCVGGRNENQVYRECRYRYRQTISDTRKYKSPIGMQCQKNAIVLLSDGAPSKNSVDRGDVRNGRVKGPYHIRNLIYYGTNAVVPNEERISSVHDVTCTDLSNSVFNQPGGKYRWGNCGPEIVEFLHEYDQIPALEQSSVETYTIGFGINGTGATEAQEYLRLLAAKGGGQFYEADNVNSLVASITSIISSITSKNQSLTGISLSIDNNRMSTARKTYIGQFVPSNERSWEGNIKGYFLGPKGILDVNGKLAVSDGGNGAEYESGTRSFWSEDADGSNVTAGGLRNRLDPDSRTLYVNTRDGAPASLKLNEDEALLLTATNTALTSTMLGLPPTADAATREALIDWARSAQMKAPLHAVPTVVHYGGDRGDILFTMNNLGYLHAFDVTHPTTTNDTSGGDELFAFMPHELIGNLAAIKANGTSGQHIYGLDGPMTLLAEDINGDGKLVAGADRVILYFGMRRGGKAYYAMDVTDPQNPILLWRIDPERDGFSGLGQSWSRMVLTTIRDGGDQRKVLVFGAGYDTDQDGYAQRHADDQGAGLYIVDAYSGDVLMSLGANGDHFSRQVVDMKYSIPAEPRVVDLDDDNLADRIYVGDMGGQLWSIDLPDGDSITEGSNYVVHRVAVLAGDGVADNRRFYYPPAISRVIRNGNEKLALAIGSGYRAHPLNKNITDRFYVVFDESEKNGEELPTTIEHDVLFDLTNDLVGPGSDPDDAAVVKSRLALKKGWYITLPAGRKVISEARILAGSVMFNAFSANGSVCEGVTTRNEFYLVSLLDARALIDLDEVDEVIKPDRWITLDYSGIATAPSLVFMDPADNPEHKPTMDIYVGQEKVWSQAERIYKIVRKTLN